MHNARQLPSGRWQGAVRLGGRGAKRLTRTFDFEWEAIAWMDEVTGQASGARALAPDLAPAPVMLGADTPTVSAYAGLR